MKKGLLGIIIVFLFISSIIARDEQDYISLYTNNEYQKAYELIILKLNGIYSKRVEDRK